MIGWLKKVVTVPKNYGRQPGYSLHVNLSSLALKTVLLWYDRRRTILFCVRNYFCLTIDIEYISLNNEMFYFTINNKHPSCGIRLRLYNECLLWLTISDNFVILEKNVDNLIVCNNFVFKHKNDQIQDAQNKIILPFFFTCRLSDKIHISKVE